MLKSVLLSRTEQDTSHKLYVWHGSLAGNLILVSIALEIHRSIRLRPRRTSEQEHVSLSNAILHNSVARAKHMRTHVGLYSVGLLVVQWVVIGQYAMGRSLMDGSIGPGSARKPL